jgi:hypothetical protein
MVVWEGAWPAKGHFETSDMRDSFNSPFWAGEGSLGMTAIFIQSIEVNLSIAKY